ncbi:hypothetical protein J2S55_001535 [Streptosporangium brasiliense]|uniref:Uncharacterized protein n=1 Tax=Streptosporangium brasiliense TaxID=47480 RepID=A0ABT9QZ66_9ACTN|nr:hypothetical protein [Streptosporangium brasiliense]
MTGLAGAAGAHRLDHEAGGEGSVTGSAEVTGEHSTAVTGPTEEDS